MARSKNDTHVSTSDPDAKLYRKAAGREARLSVMGHVIIENRNGLAVAGQGKSPSGGELTTPPPAFVPDVIAVYDDNNRTIYLMEGWNSASIADQSILVHEMTHHLQNQAHQRFDCAGAREKSAYIAQKEWLEAHGLDLEKEFEVDMFTVLAMSLCM